MSAEELAIRSVANAAASVEMEGYSVDSESREWCVSLLKGEITLEQYIAFAKKKSGVSA